jgi:transcriptional regulator with XRE-family HTH domain
MSHPRNIVGPQIKRLREKCGLTQPMLVAKCNLLGWDISRETLAKIESQIKWVADAELVFLARALSVPIGDLLPGKEGLSKALGGFFRC